MEDSDTEFEIANRETFRIIIEKSLIAFQQRLNDNLSLTAQERYLKFCKI